MKLAITPTRPFWPILTLPHLWAITAVATVFVSAGLGSIWVGDFWWHLKVGELIATKREIPGVDSFSFVGEGLPYAYQQWLGELYLYTLYRLGGIELALLANTAVLTSTAAMVLWLARDYCRGLRVAGMCTLAGILIGMPSRDVRPQTLGFLFFTLCYLTLYRYRTRGRAPLWLLPLTAAVWTNVHGSAMLGFALAALVLASEAVGRYLGPDRGSTLSRRQLAHLALATATMPLAMLLNPWGIGFFKYALTIQSNPVIQNAVTEWAAPTIRDPQNIPFFAAFLACVALFALSPKPLKLTETVLFVVFGALALQAVRNSMWFGIVAAPLAAGQFAAVAGRMFARSQSGDTAASRAEGRAAAGAARPALSRILTNYVFLALVLAIAFATLPWVKGNLSLPPKYRGVVDVETPVAAVRFATVNFPNERFFHPDTYGGYMIWAASGRLKVFIDGRIELYPLEVWQDYIQISLAQDWEARLDKYGIRHVLLPKRPLKDFQRPLLKALAGSSRWEPVYEDEISIIYVHRS